MMRKISLFLVVLLVFSLALSVMPSQGLEFEGQDVDITLSEAYVSRYIWRGQDLYGENDAAYQPSIDIALPEFLFGTDVSLNVWGSFPLRSGHEDAEEFDYTVTFSRDLIDNVNVSVGHTYFDFPNTTSKTDVSEPWLSVTLNKIPAFPIDVAMSVFAGYDFQTTSGGPDEGWYYSWGFDTELPLPIFPIFQKDQTLALGIVNWGNDGVADLKPSSLYATELSFSSSYAFWGFSITPGIYYTINHEEEINSGDDELWAGVDISYAF